MAEFGRTWSNRWEEPRQHRTEPKRHSVPVVGNSPDPLGYAHSHLPLSSDRPAPVGAAMPSSASSVAGTGDLGRRLSQVQAKFEGLSTEGAFATSDSSDTSGGGTSDPAPMRPSVRAPLPPHTDRTAVAMQDWSTPAVHRHLKHFLPGSHATAGSALPQPAIDGDKFGQDFDHWEPLVRSKDNLLHQKDLTIQRLQREADLLKRQCHESELRMQQVVRRQAEGDHAALDVKLAETQNDLALAHAQAEQVRKQTERQLATMQATLGKSEYSLSKAQKRIDELEGEQAAHGKDVKKMNLQHDDDLDKLRCEVEESAKREEATKQRVQSLERYLTKVPTPQEVKKSQEALTTWRERCQAAEDACHAAQEALGQKEDEMEAQRSELDRVKAQVSALLQLQSGSVQEQLTNTSHCSREELQALLLQSQAQCSELHGMLEKTQSQTTDDMQKVRHRYKQLYARATAELQKECQLLKQRAEEQDSALHEEKLSNKALQERLSERQSIIDDLRSTTTQLVTQNQELLDHSLQLEQAHQQQGLRLRSLSSESIHKVRSVQAELRACVGDLRNLIQVWKSFVDGHDPDMSRLLGLSAPVVPEQPNHDQDVDTTGENFVEDLEAQLGDVRKLRTEVDQLRSLLADQYAQELGSSCPIQ
ncbi:centrosomal protein of 85 kDa-like [Sycon ciliatum]|uniref:centrosomal protein of 85 kDa-like n=1 Tax=Sycon ciliatum TaxID=27933 RepID=UPI0031F612F5